MHEIKRYDSFNDLIHAGFGSFENIFYCQNADFSKAIVLLNGAVTKKVELPLFQRWSWAKKFRHPVFCMADPLTWGSSSVPIGWYQSENNFFESQFSLIKNALPQSCKLVVFGSSAGGFASLLAAHLGLSDISIAINPQTNIFAFDQTRSLDAFVKKTSGYLIRQNQYSLVDLGFDRAKRGCKIIYVQNVADAHHYERHMQPYVMNIFQKKLAGEFALELFEDSVLRHDPPDLNQLMALRIGDFNQLLW